MGVQAAIVSVFGGENDRPDVLNRGMQLTSHVVDQQGVLKIAYLKQF